MKRLLLLEDDTALSSMIELSLKQYEYELDCFSTIEEAQSAVEQKVYDLLLLDVQIDNDKSFGFTQRVRSRSDVPIIFISALDDEMHIMSALNIGGDDYVTKPFSMGVLVSRIEAVLRRSGSREVREISSEDILLDLAKLTVTVAGTEVDLTVTEYRLMRYMMENPRKIISRTSLAVAVWEESELVDDNTVAVNIYRLRKKLEDAGKDEIIKTVRGLGYQFTGECVQR